MGLLEGHMGISWNPRADGVADPMGVGPRGWGNTSHQLSSYMVFYLGFFLHIYRHTSERVWVQFQTTAIRQILQESESHEFFWFSSAYKNYVYTTQWPIKYAVGFCLEKQCTCCNLKALY